MQHLLTHVSGLPDQLPENNELRGKHARSQSLPNTRSHAADFAPGSKYHIRAWRSCWPRGWRNSSAGRHPTLVDRTVFQPLKMEHSAQGLGRFKLEDMVPCQIDHAAPEAGGGDPTAKEWDWNSRYWRSFGAPWGGAHCSAGDVGRFLGEFLHAAGAAVKPATARLMVTNHNPPGLTPRGLGLAVGPAAGSKGCSALTFGHTGSTGTIAWADPKTRTICVVLTSCPGTPCSRIRASSRAMPWRPWRPRRRSSSSDLALEPHGGSTHPRPPHGFPSANRTGLKEAMKARETERLGVSGCSKAR